MTRKWQFILFLLMTGIFLSACNTTSGAGGEDSDQLSVISGSISYRERIAMPADAVIRVQLLDISKQDVAATIIAEQRIRPSRQVPIPFTLQYDRSEINRRGTYSVAATIEVEGEVVWRSTTIHPVLTNGNPVDTIEIVVERIR